MWDLRMLQRVFSYSSPGNRSIGAIDISQRGMLAMSAGDAVFVYKDALVSKQHSVYLTHTLSALHSQMSTHSRSTLSSSVHSATHTLDALTQHRSALASRSSGALGCSRGITELCFCPFQDALAVGYGAGVETLISVYRGSVGIEIYIYICIYVFIYVFVYFIYLFS